MRFGTRTYLDWASAAPVSARAGRTFRKAIAHYGNPSAPHTEGREARALVEEARTRIARVMEVKADDVIFTSGATEANALAIEGAVRGSGKSLSDIHVLYLPTAHASSVETIAALAAEGLSAEPLQLAEGAIDLVALAAQLRPETLLITIDAVCGETGTRYDTRAVRRALSAIHRNDVLIHADISQLPLVESIERARLGADLITLDAQKVGGVRGVGALIAPRRITLTPIVHGGGQERGLRSGTEPAALIAAFAEALSECAATHAVFSKRAGEFRKALIESVERISDVVVNEGKSQTPHILNLSLLGRDTDYLVALLDEAGFAVSTKSSCETDATGSRVVMHMTGDAERAASTLRISMGPTTTRRDINSFMKALHTAVAFLDSHAR